MACTTNKDPKSPCCLSFGAIADIQYADIEDGYNFCQTRKRYYRTALPMLDKAVQMWNGNNFKKPQFVLQLGDIIDGKNKHHGISESSLSTVLQSFSKFQGPVYHIWGNHEFYNFSRERLLASDLYSGKATDCKPVPNKAYYTAIPHPKLRIIALDCYEISILASIKGTAEHDMAVEIMKNNTNDDKNSSQGMDGTFRRFVEYNGSLSEEQLKWLEGNLKEAEESKQNVIIIGHCGIFEEATDQSCLCWNAPEVLQLVHQYHRCVLAYLSGHDHGGGLACDEHNILYMAFPGVLENNVAADFGTFYMYYDRLELVGNGRVYSLTLPLRYCIPS